MVKTITRSVIGRGKSQLKRSLRPVVQNYSKKRVDLAPALWRLQYDADGTLGLDGVALNSFLEQFGSPLHVVDGRKLDENVDDFLAKPADAETGCEVYYSYKTNPVPGVLQRMHARGIGAEVISAYELWLALQLGVPTERIVYNGPAKSEASLIEAIQREIGLINFNNREEIARVAALARRLGKRPRVGVRAVVPGGWGGQFGEQVATGAAMHAFKEAVAAPELTVVALHVHMGGEIASAGQVADVVAHALSFVDELHTQLGVELEVLDFGGSLACPTTVHLSDRDLRLNRAFHSDLLPRSPEAVLSIRAYAAQIVLQVENHFHARGRKPPRIFLEPGRAMTANTQMLLCRVMNVREADGDLPYVILDAGINLAESVRSEYHQLFPVRTCRTGKKRMYRLAGPICTPADILYNAWKLPELQPGDALAIMDAGAYFVPFATSFSFPQPAIVLFDGRKTRLLRRAETFEDLVKLDNTP